MKIYLQIASDCEPALFMRPTRLSSGRMRVNPKAAENEVNLHFFPRDGRTCFELRMTTVEAQQLQEAIQKAITVNPLDETGGWITELFQPEEDSP